MNFRRIALFALIFALVPPILGLAQGLIVSSTWEWYQDPIAAVNISRTVRRILLALVALVLYVVFLRGTRSKPALAAVFLFLAVTALSTAIEVALGSSIADAMPPQFILSHLVVVAVAFAWVHFVTLTRPNTSLERTRDG